MEPADSSPPGGSKTPQLGSVFRGEVSTPEFDRIYNFGKEVESAKNMIDSVEDKAIAAQLLTEMSVRPEVPNEVKLHAFREALNLIDTPKHFNINIGILSGLIDVIRAQSDPSIRIRMTSILSHDVQQDYFIRRLKMSEGELEDKGEIFDYHGSGKIKESNQGRSRKEVIDEFLAKSAALANIADNDELPQVYRNWAKTMLEPQPSGIVSLFNSLYERDSDLKFTPRIMSEITDISQKNETGVSIELKEMFFTGKLIMLNALRLPTPEKLVRYKQETGRGFPIFFVHRVGAKFHAIEFPLDLSERASELVEQFRNGVVTRPDLKKHSQALGKEFIERLNPQQRAEIEQLMEQGNLEIRFATERSTSEPAGHKTNIAA